jgi:enoyl-CoA hydratase/carnithine racemase
MPAPTMRDPAPLPPVAMTAPPAAPFQGARVALSLHGSVAVVRLSNPPTGLMDDVMEAELEQVLAQLDDPAAWPGGRVVVLTGGEPGVFVRHYDVAVLHQRGQALRARGKTFTLERPVPPAGIHRCIERIERSALVFIAAVNGTAMGGGFELALACDLRVVQHGPHQLGLPELNAGLLPGATGTQVLTRLLGPALALQCLLTARVFRPEELPQLGLAQACVDDALAHALQLAARLQAVPARACAHIKRLVRDAAHRPAAESLAAERTLFCDCMVDPEAEPLMRAIAEGRRTLADPPG